MDKKPFYREQAEKFRDYASKFPNGNLLSLFEEWAESKDIYGVDRHEIWRIVRRIRAGKVVELKEGSEESVRVLTTLDILLLIDLARLGLIMEKRKNKLDKT